MGRDVPSVFCCLLLSNHGDNFNQRDYLARDLLLMMRVVIVRIVG